MPRAAARAHTRPPNTPHTRTREPRTVRIVNTVYSRHQRASGDASAEPLPSRPTKNSDEDSVAIDEFWRPDQFTWRFVRERTNPTREGQIE